MADHGERDMEINLLFCETFSHDHGEELNLDLVQFPRPVCISEVRIIPPGAKAHSDLHEDSKLGKTSPGDFRLELFINNLSNPGSAVFERLGTLEYHETTDIQLVTNSKIPTDGVILRGIYSSITIAIYGVLTSVSKPGDDRPPSPPPPPPPPQTISKSLRAPETKSQDTEYISDRQRERERRDYDSERARRQKYDERYSSEQRNDDIERSSGGTRQSKPMSPPGPPPDESQGPRTPPPRERRGPRTPPGTPKSASSPESLNLQLDDDIHEPGEIPEDGESLDRGDDLFEALTPETSPGPVCDEEINEGASSLIGEESEGYESISEDEVSSLTEIFPFPTEEPWMYVSTFNPFQFEISTPLSFPVPDQSAHEREKLKAKSDDPVIPETANKINEFVSNFKTEEHASKWVSALEELPSILNPGLAYVDDSSVQVLVDWTIEALDLDTAITQSIAVNIRQIKAGVKLTSALCDCGPSVANKLIEGSVQEKLLTLLFDDNMASSLKLMILQALDSSTNWSGGIEKFLGTHQGPSGDQLSGYQKALKLMLSDQTVRVVTAVSALLKKAHVYEALGRLKTTTESIMENTPALPESSKDSEHKEEAGDRSPEKMMFIDTTDKSSAVHTPDRSDQGLLMEADIPMTSPTSVHCTASTQDVETIMECLGELCYVLNNAANTIVQPPIKAFPTTAKVTGPVSTADPYPVLYHMFNARRLLETLLLLLSCPATSGHLEIFESIREIIQQCMKSQQGLLFLAYNNDTVKVMIQTLTNNYDEENIEDGSPHQLGLQLIYHLQALQNIDQLTDLLSSKKSPLHGDRDNADVISTLHSMYAMTLHTYAPYALIGKCAVAHVFNLNSNLDSLLPFLELSGDVDADHSIKKSASYGYASGLLLMSIQYCDNVETLKSYASKIHTVCQEQSELSNWLAPIQGLTFDISSITPLVEYMKNHTSELSSNFASVGPAFVTAVRVLRYLSCPRHEYDNSAEHQKNLHYNLAAIQLFSAEAMEVFISVLKKLGDFLLRPWQQGFPHPSGVNHIIESIVVPLLIVTRRMLTELLSSTSTEFRDVRLVSCMLTLHTVLCSPSSSTLSSDTSRVQSVILDILLTFTKPALKADTEDAVNNSAWTMMLKEVLEYIPSAPYTFMSGLSLLLELLPLPLPMQVQEALSEDEAKQALNTRKLWSIHLHSLGPKIQQIINDLAGTGYHPLQHILRRVCWQLADLATPSALLVVRYVFELLHNELNKAIAKEDSKDETKTLEVVAGQANRVLMLLMYLVSQPPVKAPLLHLLRSNVKTDEKYAETMSRLLNLLNTVSDSPTHLQSQECIVAIVQSICDPEVTLMSTETSPPLPEQLANSLPTRDHLEQIIVALLEHIGNMEQSYATVLLCLRTLIMLTEHDYTFYHLKCALEKNVNSFFNLFRKLASTFNKDSADCLSTLSTFLELLQLLLSPENMDEEHHAVTATVRTFTVSEGHLMTLLRWSTNPSDDHPIRELEKQLMDCCKEDEAMGTLLLEITNLSQVLNATHDLSAKSEEMIEPVLPAPDSLNSQFNHRACYLVGDIEDDRISYWLTIPPLDDPDIDMDMVKVDFEELSEKCCPDFDLKEEIAKGFAGEDSASPRKKMRLGKRKFDPLIARSERKGMGQMRRGHKGMPGRGGRSSFYQGGRPHDLFRQRAQNTSRPPSMHVDDFEAMENQPQQQHHMSSMKKGPPIGRQNRGGFLGSGGPGYQRGGFAGGPGTRWGGQGGGGGYNRRDLGPTMGNMQGRMPNMMGNRQQQTSPGGYQGRQSRGFLSRRPDNRLSTGPTYNRPLPPQGRQDGLYGSPGGRGGPRGGMRGSPSSGRGMPSPTRKPYRGFRGGMPSGGRWVGPGGKTDPHTRFIPPKPTRGGYGRHDGGSRHGGSRPFTR